MDAQFFGHADEIRHGIGMHSTHAMATVQFDRDLTEPQLCRDLLVEEAENHALKHLALTDRQRIEPVFQQFQVVTLEAGSAVDVDGLVNGIEQILLPERLREELHRAGLHRPDRHPYVTMPRHENDRDGEIHARELVLKIESADTRHSDIQYEAARRIRLAALQELPGRRVDLHAVSDGSE